MGYELAIPSSNFGYSAAAKDPISALTSVQRGQSSVALAANTPKENFEVPEQNGLLGGGDLGNKAKAL